MIFTKNSLLYTKKVFHERYFYSFALKTSLVYENIEIYYLEFSQPGGSDQYDKGFQHLEFLTCKNIREISPLPEKTENLLFFGKYDSETYLKWSDKKVLKVRTIPMITLALFKDNSEVFLNNKLSSVDVIS